MGVETQSGAVIARQQDEIWTELAALHAGAFQIARGVLDADNVGMGIVQARNGIDAEIDNGAAGDTVENDRNANGAGNGGEMLEQPLLIGLVVIGHDREHRIGASRLGELGQRNGLGGGIGTSTRDNRHALIGDLDADLDDTTVFFMADGGAFARGAHRHQAVGSLGKLPLDEAGEGFLINDPIAHGSDERRNRSSQHLSKIPRLGLPRQCHGHWFDPAIEPVFGRCTIVFIGSLHNA